MTHPNPSPAVAFRVEHLGNYFVPVIVHANGGEYRSAPCACLDQAAAEATRNGTRPLPFAGLRERNAGALADVAPDLTCPVDPAGWTWSYHRHTHGTLDRLARVTAR